MSNRAIREAIQILAGTNKSDSLVVVDAEIISVDRAGRTCVCQQVSGAAGIMINNVRLMSSADDGLLILPTVGSTVCVTYSNAIEPFISQYSGVDKVIFRGGNLGGMVIIGQLLTKINTLENKLNDLVKKYNSHTHNVTAIGAPTGPSLLQEAGRITPTVLTDLENKNITHG